MVRISGAGTKELLRKFFIPQKDDKASFPRHRHMTYLRLVDSEGGLIDECSAVYYNAPHSYTGEDMAEVFLHGSAAVMNALFALLGRESGVRPAEAGEFTKRAFLNGKLDLSGAEAVMDMISADTELSRRAAAYQLEGGLRKRIDALYDELTDIAAYSAAVMDYPEEMEDEALAGNMLASRLNSVKTTVDLLIKNGLASKVLREGARVVIMGEPNSGKSSLLNALLLRERAIVTPQAGTTRDTIEERADVNGIPVTFIDTAGIRASKDDVERLGIERAWKECENADLVLWLHPKGENVTKEEAAAFASVDKPKAVVYTKADLGSYNCNDKDGAWGYDPCMLSCDTCLALSSKTGEGIEQLKNTVASLLHPTNERAVITNSRHITALRAAADSIKSAIAACEEGMGLDCCSTDIEEAMNSIGAITGRTASEDVINAIFGRFCVGK